MRTAVTVPEGWAVEERPDGRRVLLGPGWPTGARADLALVLYPLTPLPDPTSAAIARLVERDLAAGSRLHTVSSTEGHTDLGAPMVLVEAQVLGADGAVLEDRLGAHYQFLEYGGGALVGSRNPTRLAEHRAQLLAILASARADFTGHIAALEQLYKGMEEDASWAPY